MARVLVVTNRKGGTGKTSSAVNIAAELANQHQRVLLIDLDTQGHCALGLGVKAVQGSPTVHSFFLGNNKLKDALQQTSWPDLSLIPADPLFDHGSGMPGDFLLRDALQAEGLHDAYDYIILDTPPSLDALLMNALCAANRVLVPFVPHFLAGEGVRQLARVLFRVVSKGLNEELKLLGFLPVMMDLRIGQHKQVIERIAHQFGAERLLTGIRNDIRVVEAFSVGKPVHAYAAKSRAAQDYALAARDIMAWWK
jgi:chromosome partitioning protein